MGGFTVGGAWDSSQFLYSSFLTRYDLKKWRRTDIWQQEPFNSTRLKVGHARSRLWPASFECSGIVIHVRKWNAPRLLSSSMAWSCDDLPPRVGTQDSTKAHHNFRIKPWSCRLIVYTFSMVGRVSSLRKRCLSLVSYWDEHCLCTSGRCRYYIVMYVKCIFLNFASCTCVSPLPHRSSAPSPSSIELFAAGDTRACGTLACRLFTLQSLAQCHGRVIHRAIRSCRAFILSCLRFQGQRDPFWTLSWITARSLIFAWAQRYSYVDHAKGECLVFEKAQLKIHAFSLYRMPSNHADSRVFRLIIFWLRCGFEK